MLDTIRRRRSIRKYLNRPIQDDMIETLLRAAMQAPSARNLQPWEFIVIRDRETLARIPDYHPYSSMVPGAGAAVLVCGNTELQVDPGYIAQDCSAAVENLLLEAVNQGLGAVWLGVFPRKERIDGMVELFDLPQNIIPVALVSLGYPAEDPGFQDRYAPLKVHMEKW
ncbi:MAG: nitroreductase family protein [Candidatus Fermentibacteraceae bacterium]|nr:nitroreductase family protein [Candidatus Fermentibacteraceae bacterium]MBN2608446.1 nitroreductase family protein [Candidatus Fermentibacteraceae bacterium]